MLKADIKRDTIRFLIEKTIYIIKIKYIIKNLNKIYNLHPNK